MTSNAEGVRAEYDRLREAHYLAADHLKMLDRERETVLLEYHSTFNQMIETSVRLQRLLHNDGRVDPQGTGGDLDG